MLRSDGTTAGDAVAVPPPPPQAIATIPTTPSAGTSLANLIGSLSYLSHLLPSSRTVRGESAPANRPYSEAPGGNARPCRACLTPTCLSRVRSCGSHNLFKLLTNLPGRP